MAGNLSVLIDARMMIGRFSGVARMVTRLVENLTTMPNVRVIALCGSEPYGPWASRSDIELIVSDFSRRDRSPARRLLWEATKLRTWIVRSGADIFHATWNTGVPFRSHVPTILTVHDVIPWDEPVRGLSSRVERSCYRYSFGVSVRRTQRVVAVSGFSADQIARKACIDPSRMRVIYNGVEVPRTVVDAAPRAERRYLLYVGGCEPRKNLEGVFIALERYWLKYDSEMELHLTGSANQLSNVASQAYELLGNDSRIHFLGSPSDEELAREYSNATALLMLSRAEGFGLPVIEAMAHGCPVIAARCGALPEIVGDAGILIDPGDVELIAGSIHKIARSPGLASEFIALGRQRAENFTWKRAAEAYLREYQIAASNVAANAEQAFSPQSRVAAGFR